eukprot:11623420-Alexandrium_andersonii.AAC.1
MQQAWAEVISTDQDQQQLTAHFLARYASWVVRRPEHQLGPVEPSGLQQAFRSAPANSLGLDGRHPSELQDLPMVACKWLC